MDSSLVSPILSLRVACFLGKTVEERLLALVAALHAVTGVGSPSTRFGWQWQSGLPNHRPESATSQLRQQTPGQVLHYTSVRARQKQRSAVSSAHRSLSAAGSIAKTPPPYEARGRRISPPLRKAPYADWRDRWLRRGGGKRAALFGALPLFLGGERGEGRKWGKGGKEKGERRVAKEGARLFLHRQLVLRHRLWPTCGLHSLSADLCAASVNQIGPGLPPSKVGCVFSGVAVLPTTVAT